MMMRKPREFFKNKTVLIICIEFFNYHIEICDKLKSFEANVIYIDERPKNSVLIKSIVRLKKSLIKKRIDDYYRKKIVELQGQKIDYLLLIRGEVVPRFFIEKIKQMNPDCTFRYYNWDSFKNCQNAQQYLGLFDRVFTFDKDDALELGLNHRPLFCLDDYLAIGDKSIGEKEIDVLFIGTAHTDRYFIAKNVEGIAEKQNRKTYFYFYLQSPIVYFYKRIFEKEFKEVQREDMVYESLGKEGILSLYKKSKAVLDIQHPHQTGLTMRTFEALGAGKKLITTNSRIKEYKFYNPSNIVVIDRNDVYIPSSFFDQPFEKMNEDITWEISLEGWISELFIKPLSNSDLAGARL